MRLLVDSLFDWGGYVSLAGGCIAEVSVIVLHFGMLKYDELAEVFSLQQAEEGLFFIQTIKDAVHLQKN